MSETSTESIGPYKLDRLLSTGATAQVWLATGPDGDVVVKVARSEAHRDAIAREARALALVDSPRVVKLLEASPEGWLAVEAIDGEPIDRWAAGRPTEDVLRAAAAVVEALKALQAKGIVHGDLKPANVIVDLADQPRLIDLGIASLPGDAPKGFRGTPGYAAPEVLRGERPTVATDVYGLGAVLYACFAGRPPFSAPDPAALGYLPLVSLPAPPAAFAPSIPGVLNQLILTMLARDPTRRPVDLDRLTALLGRVGAGAPGAPIVGMLDEREQLRRAVVGVVDGECRVVVVYGPPGSGRRTLISEAVEAARREGLTFLKEGEPLDVKAIKSAKRPPVLAVRASQTDTLAFARSLLEQHVPALVLVHSERPLPQLGPHTIHIAPPPLSLDDARALVGLQGAAAEKTEAWWRESLGHPISLLGRIRVASGARPSDKDLPLASRKVLQAVRRAGEVALPELAKLVGLNEHELLDHAEVLLAEELVAPAKNGAALAITERGRRPTTEVPE